MKYKTIIFDIDGTIINSFLPYLNIMKKLLPQYQKAFSKSLLKKTFSMSTKQELQTLKIPQVYQKKFIIDYALVEQKTTKAAPYPGIEETLKKLHRNNFKLGILTSRTRAETNALFKNYSFMKLIEVTATADDIPYQKPNPRPLIETINKMHSNKTKTLYIGDSPVDEKTAQRAKVSFGLAKWGSTSLKKFSFAKFIFNSPLEILKLL